jgi:2-dehydropantoate 2-reductase
MREIASKAEPGAGDDKTWPRVAVLGAGAVGCYFGGMLARAGAQVTLIGRPQHVEALERDGLWLESIRFQERVPVVASVDPEAARDAAVVLFSVKTLNTDEAARSLAPNLSPAAVVVSLQNGVDNVERIRAAGGFEALPAVVYVAAAMTGPGRVKHSGRGDLIVGDPSGGRRDELDVGQAAADAGASGNVHLPGSSAQASRSVAGGCGGETRHRTCGGFAPAAGAD